MKILSNVDYNEFIEKSKIKRLKNIDLLAELPFYDQLHIIKTEQTFKGYARSYKVEIVDKKRSDCTIRSK